MDDRCQVWTGAKKPSGYGRFSVDGKSVLLIGLLTFSAAGEHINLIKSFTPAIILSVVGSTILALEIVTSTLLTNS